MSLELKPEDLDFAFDHLSRPECVVITATAGIFVSHDAIGVQRILPNGDREFYGYAEPQDTAQFTPNGIALDGQGRLLIANTALRGGVWQVDRSNQIRPLVMEADGRHLCPANFVLADRAGRLWVTVSTRAVPRSKAYTSAISDGYIVLIDQRGARIVADGLGYTNECRLTGDGRWLYVNETFGRRVSRFPVEPDGALGERETVCVLGHGDYPDGGAFDAEGHYWITSVVSNRIYRIGREGESVKVFEDSNSAYVDKVETAFQAGQLSPELLYTDAGKVLNHLASISFGGDDMRTAYLGTLKMDRLPTFRSRVPGLVPDHWTWSF
jgi:sugar lactone lactonase YvrE